MYFITGLLKSVFGCCIAFSLSARHTVRKSGNMYLHSADVSQIYLHSADVSQIYLHQIYISQRYIWRSGFTIHISSEISEQYLCSRYNVNVRKKQKCKNTKIWKQAFFSSGRLSICALLCKDTKAIWDQIRILYDQKKWRRKKHNIGRKKHFKSTKLPWHHNIKL